MSNFTPLEFALEGAMSDLSETCWCAGWYSGCDVAFWDAAHGRREQLGMFLASEVRSELDAILALAEAAGSWIAWPGDPRTDDQIAVPLDEWKSTHLTSNEETQK